MLPMPHKPAAGPARREIHPSSAECAGGFTLMEILVAMTILGVGFVALFGVLSTSLGTVSRIGDRETLVRSAQMKLNELCLSLRQGQEPPQRSGELAGKYRWRADIRTVAEDEETEVRPDYRLARVRLRVTWRGSRAENQYLLETMTWVPSPPEQ